MRQFPICWTVYVQRSIFFKTELFFVVVAIAKQPEMNREHFDMRQIQEYPPAYAPYPPDKVFSDRPMQPSVNHPEAYPLVTYQQPQPANVVGSQASVSVQVVPVTATAGGQQNSQPSDYLVWSILNFIFCCWPLGIVAVVISAHSRAAKRVGDLPAAVMKSHQALTWNIACLVVGAGLWVIFIALKVELKDQAMERGCNETGQPTL